MMKIFCLFQSHFADVGIYVPKSFEDSKFRFNLKSLLILIYITIFSLLTGIHLFFKTQSLTEISDGIHGFSSPLIILLFLYIFFGQTTNVFKLIDSFESAIQTRMLENEFKKNVIEIFSFENYRLKLILLGFGNENMKTRAIYEKANVQVEKSASIVSNVTKVTCILMLAPNLAYTLAIYFMHGLQKDDYVKLYFPAW